jgi:hypothetical protein
VLFIGISRGHIGRGPGGTLREGVAMSQIAEARMTKHVAFLVETTGDCPAPLPTLRQFDGLCLG